MKRSALWRDLLLAAGLAVAAALFFAQLELLERLFEVSRRFEWLQLDEWPMAVLAFAATMVFLYARRHRELHSALADNRRLMERLLEVQEAERHRLARELHDELGQYLNAIKLDARALITATDEETAAVVARRIATSADHVYGTAGNLVRSLRPPALDELGLVAALEACVDAWRQSHPALHVELSAGGALDGLGEKLNLAIYRIVQEALNNCVRHARASTLSVDLTREPDNEGALLLEIRDNGVGLDSAAAGRQGSGLAGMRERALSLGGSFELLSEPGQGVTIRVEVPTLQGRP